MIRLSQPSAMSAHLETSRRLADSTDRRPLGYGTGFLVQTGEDFDLVTNWHVLTGRDPITDDPKASAAKPDRIEVTMYAVHPDETLTRGAVSVALYDSAGQALWRISPSHGRHIDVVALRLPPIQMGPSGALLPYSLEDVENPAVVSPTSDVSIVGYPDVVRGRSETAVWTRATIASEPDLNFDDLPCFLVDARAREGQSGSPVVGYWTGNKPTMQAFQVGGGESWELYGVYSGRIRDGSDLGRVWKRSAIADIVTYGMRDQYEWD
ncbi:serine protease [Microbacterium sp. zg.B48]|uniref:S1 family peptidase n=1 Tax=Microbacterium sp. zg.B48 TaxID=2969408 RepID=UPI00214C0DE5|nr:serine protease [Microbacterium sp. zg.B48]MCR2761924.1 serine protease [Microbacterium sp. zg.B48]